MGALQAQYAPSMYIGLWSRIAGFERDALTEALNRREVVQATIMRVTIHLCSREDYWPLLAADPRRAPDACGCAPARASPSGHGGGGRDAARRARRTAR